MINEGLNRDNRTDVIDPPPLFLETFNKKNKNRNKTDYVTAFTEYTFKCLGEMERLMWSVHSQRNSPDTGLGRIKEYFKEIIDAEGEKFKIHNFGYFETSTFDIFKEFSSFIEICSQEFSLKENFF